MARQQEAAGLVRRLGSASPAEQLEAARGLQELADVPGGTRRIQRAGGVAALVRLLQLGGSEALQIAAATALGHMVQQERNVAKDIATAGAGRALAQRLPSSRSPELTRALLGLLELLAACGEQQLLDVLAASPGCLAHLAQLAADPSQDPAAQRMALGVLGRPALVQTSPAAVMAAAAPHAATLVRHLSPHAAAGAPVASREQLRAASLVGLLADDPQLAARMVAAGAVAPLVGLLSSASPLPKPLHQWMALAALERMVRWQPSATAHLAAIDGVAEVLVRVQASHPPPASCQLAWDAVEAATSQRTTVLLGELCKASAAQARRAIAAGALLQLARVLRWGAQRLEWLGRQQGLWEQGTEACCTNVCGALAHLLLHSGPGPVTPAVQAELLQLVQQALHHSRHQDTLRNASALLVLLRDLHIQSTPATYEAVAEVLRQLQPGGHPDRAAAVAELLAELAGEAQQQQEVGGSGAVAAAARPSSSSAATQQAGEHNGAVPAACAACHALPPAGRKFQVCGGCRAVRYCSPACQKAAWRSGHKVACRAAQGGAQGRA
jgi:hypothetical protein